MDFFDDMVLDAGGEASLKTDDTQAHVIHLGAPGLSSIAIQTSAGLGL